MPCILPVIMLFTGRLDNGRQLKLTHFTSPLTLWEIIIPSSVRRKRQSGYSGSSWEIGVQVLFPTSGAFSNH